MQSETVVSKKNGSQLTARTQAFTICWNLASPVGRPPGTRTPPAPHAAAGPPSPVEPPSGRTPPSPGAEPSGRSLASDPGSPPSAGGCDPSGLAADPPSTLPTT